MNVQNFLTFLLEAVTIVYVVIMIGNSCYTTNDRQLQSQPSTAFTSATTTPAIEQPKPVTNPLPSISEITLKTLQQIAKKDREERAAIEQLLGGKKYYRARKQELYDAIATLATVNV